MRLLALVPLLVISCKPAEKANSAGASTAGHTDTATSGTETPTATVTESETATASETETEAATATATDTVTPVGQVALITSPVEILTTIDAAVQSTFAGNLGADGNREDLSFAPGQVAIESALALAGIADECTGSGRPRSPGSASPDDELGGGDANFAAGRFYCLLRFNTYAPNSVQGAYYQNKAFLCELDRKGALVEGEEKTAQIDFGSKECFSDEFRALSFEDGVPPPFDVKVRLARPSIIAPEKWDTSVAIELPAELGDTTIVILSKTTDGGLSTAAVVGGSSYVLTYDVVGGTLRIDQHSLPNPQKADDKGYSHYRIYAKGTIGDNLQFTSLTKFIGVDANSYEEGGERSVALHSFAMDFAAGGKALSWLCGHACTTLGAFAANSATPTCYAGNGGVATCAGVTPLTPATDADLAFSLIPGSGADPDAGDALLVAGPLTFDTVTWAVVEP